MPSKTTNEYGSITIDNEVIARIAGLAAMDCYGIKGMASKSVKDGFATLLKRENLTKGIRLDIGENSVSIDLHIIVQYGTNISAIADTLVTSVKYKVEECVGINVEDINIFVEGINVDE